MSTSTTTTTTSDSSAIDDKKTNNISGINVNSKTLKQYIQAIIPSIIKAFIYFLLGSILLYATLSAQAGLFPTNIEYYPYTEKIPNLQKVVSNIYETADGEYSQKIFFDYNSNRTGNSILDLLRSLDKKDSGVLSMFVKNIMQNIIRLNYGTFSEMCNTIKEFEINDFYIVLFGPILMILFIFVFVMFVNPIYFVYLWFTNLGLFIQKDIHDPSSEYYGLEESGYWGGVGLIILFIFLFMMLFGFLGLFVSVVAIFIVIFSAFRFKCNLNGKDGVGFGTIFKNNMSYYKDVLAILISFVLVTNANVTFGPNAAAIIVVVLIAIYFGVISIDFYKSSELDKLSKSLPNKRAEIIPDNTTISNLADKAKKVFEEGKAKAAKAFEEGKAKFKNFTSGIKMPSVQMPSVQMPSVQMPSAEIPVVQIPEVKPA
uniref:Uncharacterized protein n=1 Tax=viral metagenome TaxID=1070528 RepID=A0A6C0IEP8_9ZZZZ